MSEAEVERPETARFTRVSPRLLDAAVWCACTLVIFGLVYVIGRVVHKLEIVIIPLFVAILLAALLLPIANRLRRLGMSRGVSSFFAVFLAILVLGGVGTYVVTRANAGYQDLVTQIDALVRKIQHYLQTGPLHIKPSNNDLGTQFVNYLKDRKGEFASGAIHAGLAAVEVVGALVLTFFLTVFLVYDGERIWSWIRGLFPRSAHEKVDEVGSRMWETLAGYIRGTFTVAVIHAVAIGVTLWIVGVPLVAPLAVIVFIGGFIPLIGIIIAGGLAVLVTLVAKGIGAGIVVLIVLVVEHQIEAHILQPFVVGRHVRLHPMAIALTLTAGAVIAGLPGAIFGVPLVACLNAAFGAVRQNQSDDEEPVDHSRIAAVVMRLRTRWSGGAEALE